MSSTFKRDHIQIVCVPDSKLDNVHWIDFLNNPHETGKEDDDDDDDDDGEEEVEE